MKTVDATFEVAKEKFTITYEAVNCFEASHNLDNWEFTDDHQGGVTIKILAVSVMSLNMQSLYITALNSFQVTMQNKAGQIHQKRLTSAYRKN